MMSDKPLLEVILANAGKKLLKNPPFDVKHLISLLNHIESCLVTVEQCPPKSMQEALAPSMQALISHEIFGHSNTEVKVAVASCISEITRITAPNAPYDDDKMRYVFQLIVSVFENLDDQINQSYGKRVMILETVAKVRSCVMMLDLECDALLVKMFQHFLKAIRDDHPENIFIFVVTIMSLVLEESEHIPMELLYPLLDVVRRSNKGVLPMARKLGETVLENSAAKIKPYLLHTVNIFGSSINLYSDVVTSICPEISFPGEEHDAHGTDDSEIRLEQTTLTETSSVETAQLQAEETAEKAGDANDEKFVDLGTKKADDLYVEETSDSYLEKYDTDDAHEVGDAEQHVVKADADNTDDAEEKLVDTNSSKAPDAEFKGEDHSGETPKTIAKRKRIPKWEKAKEYDDEIIGKQVKVWWSKDLMIYEGVIVQYDPGGRNCTLPRLQQEVVHDVRMKCVAVASKHPVYELGAAALVVRSSRCATQDSNGQTDVGLLTNINLRGMLGIGKYTRI